ncbi:hypothetical protein QBC46DRAFT_347514 [Diplogelasinospora grovesii]|uniref:Uncharacterized protein n=1 Tax=Diplogelasinospora grovesii TaxID=303347 RepID=A0AAN6MZ56_9PEZI|nr:hypothetical protein QBC46DRAFT_347514 [Diplogelasinospora grovesii]
MTSKTFTTPKVSTKAVGRRSPTAKAEKTSVPKLKDKTAAAPVPAIRGKPKGTLLPTPPNS